MPACQVDTMQLLRRAVLLPASTTLSDEQLVGRFVESQDEVAFEVLVRRHGPMVFGVCRRVLRNYDDAEDAFQATFLVLVRKANSINPRGLIGNWLYGVAHKTALKARAAATRRRTKTTAIQTVPEPEAPSSNDGWSELRRLLDREVSRLPEKYRRAILLCDLQGKAYKEAARQLGWPEGTLAVRLMRGREMLAKRLTRQGLSLSSGSLALLLSQNSASAGVPRALVNATVKAASLDGAGRTAATSIKIVALTQGVLQAMVI